MHDPVTIRISRRRALPLIQSGMAELVEAESGVETATPPRPETAVAPPGKPKSGKPKDS